MLHEKQNIHNTLDTLSHTIPTSTNPNWYFTPHQRERDRKKARRERDFSSVCKVSDNLVETLKTIDCKANKKMNTEHLTWIDKSSGTLIDLQIVSVQKVFENLSSDSFERHSIRWTHSWFIVSTNFTFTTEVL